MTKNQIQYKQPLVSGKDYPGCMGRMFELNQAVAVSRLLTDKRYADGLEVSRNCLDLSKGTLEAPESRDVRREDKPNSATKMKGSAMPMKTLIAQEMSKELDSKCRPPSIVARLMGLDALPTESILTHPTKAGENHLHKKLSRKQQLQSKSTHDVQFSLEKMKASDGKPMRELSFPKSQQHATNHRDQKVLVHTHPSVDNPQEKQHQEFKEDSQTWQASMFRDYKKSLQREKLNMQLVDKQMLDHEKLNEAKMALVRQKFMVAKRLATDEKLQQSKEFLEALEILQSNKDLFLKFLQEPNSLFEKHLQDLQYTSRHLSQPKQITILKSLNLMKTHKVLKEEDNGKERSLKQGEKNEKQIKQQKGRRNFAEKNKSRELRSSSPGKLGSVCSMRDQYNKHSAASANHKNDVCSLPTRIVVLKPSPGKAQNAQPALPLYSSPRSQTLFRDPGEIKRTSSQDYLQEVRVKLEQGIRERSKDKSKITMEGVHEGFSDGPKCPREIATEIARQVREHVNTDLTNDALSSGESGSSLTGFAGNISSSSRSANSYGDVGVSSDMEICTPVNKHSWDSTNRFSPPSPSLSRLPDSAESTVNREAKKRLLERWRSTRGNEEEQQIRRISSTLGDMLALPESKIQVSESKSPEQNNKSNMGVGESQGLSCYMIELGNKNKKPIRHEVAAEWEGSLGYKNEDDDRDISHGNLLRSRSVPTSATTYHGGDLEMQGMASTVHTSDAHEIVLNRSSSSLPAGLIKPKNEKSIFKGKVSSLKGSFLLRGRRSNSKKSDSSDTVGPSSNLQLQLNELCEAQQETPVESDQWKDKLEHVICSVQQEPYKLARDVLDITTEPVEHSAETRSETSPKNDEGPVLEALDRDPIALEGEAVFSGVDTDYMTKAIPSGQLQTGSHISCSPTKELLSIEPNVSENDSEKGEHPSPVSVLDLAFQEDFSSPKRFKEISSNLHELRLRLHLLNFEASERSSHKTETLSEGGRLAFKDQDIGEADVVTENTCDSSSEAEMPPMTKSLFSIIEALDFESVKVDDILCSEEKQADLLYIRNVLVASGFTGDCDMVFARWHSPSYPLDPCLFEKIDDLCKDGMQCEMNGRDIEPAKGGAFCRKEANRSKSECRLLYDCINEVLLEILGPFFNPHPWMRPTKMNLRPMPAGEQLLKETWATICPYLYPGSGAQHTLENMVTKDLTREVVWMELRDDIETVGCEIERTILNDLLEEFICDLAS